MFASFKTCLFCKKGLNEERSGEGEHVIPKSIFGFWRSYDVCEDCISYFGQSVDKLAIQNTEIIDAMNNLKLTNVEPLLENIPWKAEDTLNSRIVQMIRRKGELRSKIVKLKNYMECPEDKFEQLVRPWLWEFLRNRLQKNEFESEYQLFYAGYKKLKPGESYESKKFDFIVTRSQLTNVSPVKAIPNDFARLIAKIVYVFLNYSVSQSDIILINEYDSLREYARNNIPMKPYLINWLRPPDEIQYNPFHVISIYPDKRYCLVDVTFFGRVTWRTVLHTDNEIRLEDPEQKRKPEAMRFILDFTDIKNRYKYIGFKFEDSEKYEPYELNV